ncbi:uncharacterized protein [Henckelia pumila]|uniref:uncharacterized protein n=1 Tax=Henckelia pumila TaxID=405737 RepID=UPI003C6DE21E
MSCAFWRTYGRNLGAREMMQRILKKSDFSKEEFPYDPEIERTLHRQRTEARRRQEEDEIHTAIPEQKMADNANLSLRQLGLLSHDMSMLDAASGGVFVDKIPIQARNFIKNMAANSQQFGTNRNDHAPRKNNEVNVSSLEKQLIELTSLVRQMTAGNGQAAKACGICASVGHATDMCPTLQEESVEEVNASVGFPGPPQWMYDPYSNTYNPGNKSKNPVLNNQMGQLATVINKLEAQHSNALPAQTIPNPRENASAITLRNGKELKVKEKEVDVLPNEELKEEPKVNDGESTKEEAPRGKFPPLSEYMPVAPFPLAIKKSRKDEGIKELYETFRRCEVNILLLDAIKQVPRYAKFLKELYTTKRKQTLKGCKKVELGENVFAVIQRKFPAKCKDPGMFSIP